MNASTGFSIHGEQRRTMKPAGIINLLLIGITGLLLIFFITWHFRLGIMRYFDADEFAHLHWAAKMLEGRKPYTDFLSFFPPGFAVSLMPALSFGWGTTQPFVTARVMTFFVFAGLCLFSALIFWELRRNLWGAILAAALLAFLPLPFDKYLEIRPDNPATLLILIAVFCQIKWIVLTPKSESKPRFEAKARLYAIISGLCYGLSYIVLPKMVPNIAVGAVIAGIYAFAETGSERKDRLLKSLRLLKGWIIGLVTPLILFAFWVLTLGNPGLVWYSLFTLPVEANKISKYFIMMQDLFFYPNGIYYGADGWSRGLFVNHTVWTIGLLTAAWRLITPILGGGGDRKKILSELLVALQFWVQVIFFIQFVPLKHAQYLIPVGVFIAWYAADFLFIIRKEISVSLKAQAVFTGIFILISLFLYSVFREVNTPKFGWSNKDFLTRLGLLYREIPQNEYVLDLTGQMLYNPDPYYACCIPFGQSAEFLSRPLPDLPKVLEETGTKYIAQGGLYRVNTLPYAWQQYIDGNYKPFKGDNTFLVRSEQ